MDEELKQRIHNYFLNKQKETLFSLDHQQLWAAHDASFFIGCYEKDDPYIGSLFLVNKGLKEIVTKYEFEKKLRNVING